MKNIKDQSTEQARWNQYGLERLNSLAWNPEKHIISDCPIRHRDFYNELMRVINPTQDKRILELGCGPADFAVWLGKQGAKVTAVEIGHDLVAAARALARLNQVDCEFRQGNITSLQFVGPKTYDLVIGMAVLHHLSEADVSQTLQECHRVLKTDGIAIFYEPVENSKLFDLIQNCFPAGKKGSDYYRPSILQRTAWIKYIEAIDERSMSNDELVLAGKQLFSTIKLSPYGFLIRLERLIGNSHRRTLMALDRFIFRILPPLKYYSQTVLVQYRK